MNMNSDLSNVKVGDWIWTISDGWEKVTEIDSDTYPTYPIRTVSESYTKDGKWDVDNKYPSAFTEPPVGFNVEPKPCELVKGQKVLVWDTGDKRRRYFSHTSDGKYYCFTGGGTEWSSWGETEYWINCVALVEGMDD